MWTVVLKTDTVPLQELPPWFLERQNLSRRSMGIDLISLDGQQAVLCRSASVNSSVLHRDIKRFLRTARWVCKAEDILLLTSRGTKLQAESDRWLRKYGAQRKTISKAEIHRLSARTPQAHGAVPEESGLVSADPLRPCQQACLEACAKGARVIQMACGTGKTRVIRELAQTIVGKVLITVPSRLLLEQFAAEFPSFCKVGTGYNKHINGSASGFIAVTDSVSLLQDFRFKAVFMDEAHHPLPSGLPECEELFLFSATHYLEADFDYTMGEAIEEGVLCDYDLTVPIITEGHPYLSLARLLQSSPGRFRRVLAYCNSIAEAKRVHQVFKTSGMASWHINAGTSRRKREAVIREFSGGMRQPVHVLVTVQVLGEGVNIPNADTCLFVQPRNSYTSIIQALGRVLRQHVSKPIAHVILPAVAMLSSEPCDDGGSTDTAANSSSDLIADANFPSATISPFRGSSHSTSEIDVQSKGDFTTRRCDDSPSRPDRKQSEASLESRDGVNDDVTQSSPRAAANLENVWLGNRVRRCVPVTDGEAKTRARRHDALPASDAAKDTVLTKRCALQRKLFRLSGTLRMQTGERYGSQLERFLSVIAHADRSLAISSRSLRCRLMFTDCRASQTSNAEVFSRRLMHKLARLLEARDPWESRFVEMERFVETYGRLPVMTDKSHLSLYYWVKNAGTMLKQGRMQVHRYQKFLNSLPSIRQRAIAWKDPTIRFKSFCERLRKYVLKYQVVPKTPGSMDDTEGRVLANWLQGQRRTARAVLQYKSQRTESIHASLRRDTIAGIHPLVSEYLESWDRPVSLRTRKGAARRWAELLTYVNQTGSLPKSHSNVSQNRMYQRLVQLRVRYPWLSRQQQLELLSSHPLIADYLQKPRPA